MLSLGLWRLIYFFSMCFGFHWVSGVHRGSRPAVVERTDALMASKLIAFDEVFGDAQNAPAERPSYTIGGVEVTKSLPVRLQELVTQPSEAIAKLAESNKTAGLILSATGHKFRGGAKIFPVADVSRKTNEPIRRPVTQAMVDNRTVCLARVSKDGRKVAVEWVPMADVVETVDGKMYVPSFYAGNYIYQGPKHNLGFVTADLLFGLSSTEQLNLEASVTTERLDDARQLIMRLAILRAWRNAGNTMTGKYAAYAPVIITNVYHGVGYAGGTYSSLRCKIENVGDVRPFTEGTKNPVTGQTLWNKVMRF